MKSDEELLAAHQAGDTQAFNELRARLEPSVRRHLDHLCRRPTLSSGVFSELAGYRGRIQSVKAWLLKKTHAVGEPYRIPGPLTPIQVQALRLIDLESHTIESAAELLGIPVATMRWRYQRALERRA